MRPARVLTLAAFALLSACATNEPEPIAYNSDACGYCRMQISDPRFGAELITRHGRAVKFDSIDCLVAFYEQAATADDVGSVWVSDYQRPGTLIDATHARFVDLGPGRAPMGRGWAAIATAAAAAQLGITDQTSIKQWSDLL